CGLFGVLAVGLFADGTYGDGWNLVPGTVRGLFYGGGFSQLWAQLLGSVVCIAWNMGVGGLAFYLVGKLVGNRVPPEVEIAGLDIPEMGAPGYPEFINAITPDQVSVEEVK